MREALGAHVSKRERFGDFGGVNIVGAVIDLTYAPKPPEQPTPLEHRVRIYHFDARTRRHWVSSQGYSLRGGEVFTDQVRLTRKTTSFAPQQIPSLPDLPVDGAQLIGGLVTIPYPEGHCRMLVREFYPFGGCRRYGLHRVVGEAFQDMVNLAELRAYSHVELPISAREMGCPAACQVPRRRLLVGDFLDVAYDCSPPASYRMRVTGFSAERGCHVIESYGQGDGPTIVDHIDLDAMLAAGVATILGPAEGLARRPSAPASATEAPASPKRSPPPVLMAQAARWRREPDAEAAGAAAPGKRAAAPAPLSVRAAGKPPWKQARTAQPSQSKARSTIWPRPLPPAPLPALEDSDSGRYCDMKEEICGFTLDVTYPGKGTKRSRTYRLYPVAYDLKTGLHKVGNMGQAWLYNCEEFVDYLDINAMYREGAVKFCNTVQFLRAPRVLEPGRGRGGPYVGEDVFEVDIPPPRPPPPQRAADAGGAGGAARGGTGGEGRRRQRPPEEQEGAAEKRWDWQLAGRVLDYTATGDFRDLRRVQVVDYNKEFGIHFVRSFEGEVAAATCDTVDLNALRDKGRCFFVDGAGDLQTDDHALLGQVLSFVRPRGAEAKANSPADALWITAKVVGWWPSHLVPPVAMDGEGDAVQSAVFVAEEVGNVIEHVGRWRFTLDEAMLLTTYKKDRSQLGNLRGLFEVFAGSCSLSLAFRREGLATLSYDASLSTAQDFATDSGFLARLRKAEPWAIVHFAPPRAIHSDPRLLEKVCKALTWLHKQGRGFVLAALESESLWASRMVQEVESLRDARRMLVDLRPWMRNEPEPDAEEALLRFVTNRAGWLAALGRTSAAGAAVGEAAGEGKGRGKGRGKCRPRGADGAALRPVPYPSSFCRAYAQAVAAVTRSREAQDQQP